MRHSLRNSGAAVAVLAAVAASQAWAGSPAAVDEGPVAGNTPVTLTVSLALNDPAAAEALMFRLSNPSDALHGQFLSPAQVQAEFGPSDAQVKQAIATFEGEGFKVEKTSSTTLSLSGTASAVEQAFSTSMHWFQKAATGNSPALKFKGPASAPVVPAAVASMVGSVVGFADAAVFHTNFVKAQQPAAMSLPAVSGAVGDAGLPLGELTVLDFDQLYDVTPLIDAGITGQGRTIGIVTLASFTPSDAFLYWNSLGLNTNPNRISIVQVDGGAGALNGASTETTLDVEQSGGVAPGANIIVYEAPNSTQSFLDAFVAAISANQADSISASFGAPEVFDFLNAQAGDTVTDPLNGEQVSFLRALHQQLIIAALQGQSVSAAAGDSGAFDTVEELGPPVDGFTDPLSVDYPGSDPALTSAGGTTLPVSLTFTIIATGEQVTVTNPTERVWAWDYLNPVCDAAGLTDIVNQCPFFSTGTGGGISVFFALPPQQFGVIGTQLSQPNQALIETSPAPAQDLFNFPAFFPGRNVPDAEFNADPFTGYEIVFTDPTAGLELLTGFGGTSFVAPQINGVTALLGQKTGHRLGILGVELYNLERLGFSFGPHPVLRTISAGDNWFFKGRNGYSPAGGVGTLDVTELAEVTF
jgi:kumamolisin